MSIITLRFIKKFVTGDISPKNISGPVGIAKGAGLTGRMGYVFFLSFMALISVNLGVLNLLPIPVLDGGHLFFYLLEGIFRKPVSAKALDILMKTGFALLCLLMIVAVFNDLYFSW
jgi:regulator of sigma E protease